MEADTQIKKKMGRPLNKKRTRRNDLQNKRRYERRITPESFRDNLEHKQEVKERDSAPKRLEKRKQGSPAEESAHRQLAAAKRLLKARKAKNNLIEFGEMMMPHPQDPDNSDVSRYDAQYFHRAVAAALEEVEKGKIKKLILTLPPRHGKSQLTSRFFPAWFMGRDPYRHMMFTTYNDPFAEDFGRDVRAIMQSDAYRLVFPEFEFRKGSAAADRLQTKEGGLAVFVGRGGSITGRGADLLVIDDPVKDRAEAKSPTIRNEIWEWFTDTVSSRLMTDTSCIIIIMTRWNEDDLVGRLTNPENPFYNEAEARSWKIINIPALAKDNDILGRAPGKALWPSRFSEEFLEGFRRRSPRSFSALYQQEPSPEDGDHIKKEMIITYKRKDLPSQLRYFAASDHAVKTKQENDFTCMIVVGIDPSGNIWLVDCWWQKAAADKQVEAMIDLMEKWRPVVWWAAKDHITDSLGPFLYRRMRERRVFCNVSQSSERGGDKVQKAQSIIGRMSMNMVRFPIEALWFERARTEMLKFDNAKHDDFVDALAHIGMGLNRLTKPVVPKEESHYKGPRVGSFAWVKSGREQQKRKDKIAENTQGW